MRERFTPLVLIAVIAFAIIAVTWLSLTAGRSETYSLLIAQGKSFTEALADASANALAAEDYYDQLVREQYRETVSRFRREQRAALEPSAVSAFRLTNDLLDLWVFDTTGTILFPPASPATTTVPDFLTDELSRLVANPDSNFVLVLADDATGRPVHYYLELSNQLDEVTVLRALAEDYTEAIAQTGIATLADRLVGESDVVYLAYQTPGTVVFTSIPEIQLGRIDDDSWLLSALDADTILYREVTRDTTVVLEFARPFSTGRYPFGLLRVGLSLERYHAIVREFNVQMGVMGGALALIMSLGLLYLSSRQKRRELGAEFSEMKSLTESIFEQIATGVAVLLSSGEITMANASFRRLFRLGESSLNWRDIDDVKLLDVDGFLASGDTTQETEIDIDSRRLLVGLSSAPTEIATGVVVVASDITRLTEFERQAARRARLSEMGNLAAGVAHEIRNPLNTIAIAAQRLAAEFRPAERSDEYAEFTKSIRAETRRLNDIISRFLALTRDDHGPQSALDLAPLLRDLSTLWRSELQDRGVSLDVSVEDELVITANDNRIRQLITNLLSNAREATPAGGTVAIEGYRDGDRVVVRVSDSGPGVSDELRESIFAPYFTTKASGTGLGLATVHQVATESRGDIHVSTGELGGATFSVSWKAT